MDNEKLNILKLLIENQEDPFSIRRISQLRKINYKSAYYALKKLQQEGIVSLKHSGNTTLCSFNMAFNDSVFTVESERRRGLLEDKNLLVMYNDLRRVNVPFILLLFGSYAKGRQTKHSDIDLLVITEDFKPIGQALSRFPLKIHTTDIRYKDFMEMLKSREFTVVSEAIKRNIILIGIEEYYRVMENANR
ncbi:MAG TPA: nucleotidyltransferase domain-containing protein [Candidatus Nanoarchaeia archaeon]|nr:nucleotidyltransferase domain-containing protein [Candidatus Nanoarchaeia archaeon]